MSYSVRYDKNYTGHHAGIGGSYNKKDWQLQNNIKSKQENFLKKTTLRPIITLIASPFPWKYLKKKHSVLEIMLTELSKLKINQEKRTNKFD